MEFNEDLSAFHGSTLESQIAYTSKAISYILSLYPPGTDITCDELLCAFDVARANGSHDVLDVVHVSAAVVVNNEAIAPSSIFHTHVAGSMRAS